MQALATTPQTSHHLQIQNRILASLPIDEYERLLPNLEVVQLPRGKVLYYAGDILQYAHFISDGQVSFLFTTKDGASIEVARTGNEGIIGIPLILRSNIAAYDAVVKIPATQAVRINAEVLRKEFDRGGKLYDMMLRYTNVFLAQIAQSVICSRFHSSVEQLARLLLSSSDLAGSDNIDLTHEDIAHMLGTRRSRVTMAARELNKASQIAYVRGKITILDRIGLEAASCECYRMVKENMDHFLDHSGTTHSSVNY